MACTKEAQTMIRLQGTSGMQMSLSDIISLVRDNPKLLLYFYGSLIQAKPVKTKTTTAAIINIIGNIVSQVTFEKKLRGNGPIDVYKTSTFGLYAATLAYFIHRWYTFLDSKQLTKNNIFIRLLFDQTLFSPIMTAYFFSFMETANYIRDEVNEALGGKKNTRKSLALRIQSRLQESYVSTQLNCWKVWPLAQYFNFSYIQPEFRVLFGNLVGFLWGIYLSFVSRR